MALLSAGRGRFANRSEGRRHSVQALNLAEIDFDGEDRFRMSTKHEPKLILMANQDSLRTHERAGLHADAISTIEERMGLDLKRIVDGMTDGIDLFDRNGVGGTAKTDELVNAGSAQNFDALVQRTVQKDVAGE